MNARKFVVAVCIGAGKGEQYIRYHVGCVKCARACNVGCVGVHGAR